MTLKPWVLAALILCALIIGALLGHRLTHNKFVVDVEDGTGKINLSPYTGDSIEWISQTDHQKVNVNFLTDSPCQETFDPKAGTSICTIKSVPEGSSFEYVCPECADPGVDPRSGSAPSLAATGLKPLSSGGSVTAVIGCPNPNGPPVVTWIPAQPGSSVNVTENIVWKAGSIAFTVDQFNVSSVPVQLCSQSPINQTVAHRVCTVVQDANQTPPYTVGYTITTTNACGSTSSNTLTVNPAPPPSGSSPGN
jgi:hypothetical protein